MPKIFAYTEKEVRRLLRKNHIPVREFNEWIYGQTCPILPSGKMGYYVHDVLRFLDWKKGGPAPYWD